MPAHRDHDPGPPAVAAWLVAEVHGALSRVTQPWVDLVLVIGLFPRQDYTTGDLLVVPRAYLVTAEGGQHPAALVDWDQFVTEARINTVIDAYGNVPAPTLLWLHITRPTPADVTRAEEFSLRVQRIPSMTPQALDDPRTVGSIAVGAYQNVN